MVTFSTTLTAQAAIDLRLELGQDSNIEDLTFDAHATMSVSAADLSGVFMYRFDSVDWLNQRNPDDIQYACDSSKLAEIAISSATVDAADIISIGSSVGTETVSRDVANWVVGMHLGTGAADVLDNEEQLVQEVVDKDPVLHESFKAMLNIYGGDTAGNHRNNQTDTTSTDSTTQFSHNYARQMLQSGLVNAPEEMANRINDSIAEAGGASRDVTQFFELNPKDGDKIVLYSVYGTTSQLYTTGGQSIVTARRDTYVANNESKNSLFANGAAPDARYADGLVGANDAWRVYKLTIDITA